MSQERTQSPEMGLGGPGVSGRNQHFKGRPMCSPGSCLALQGQEHTMGTHVCRVSGVAVKPGRSVLRLHIVNSGPQSHLLGAGP